MPKPLRAWTRISDPQSFSSLVLLLVVMFAATWCPEGMRSDEEAIGRGAYVGVAELVEGDAMGDDDLSIQSLLQVQTQLDTEVVNATLDAKTDTMLSVLQVAAQARGSPIVLLLGAPTLLALIICLTFFVQAASSEDRRAASEPSWDGRVGWALSEDGRRPNTSCHQYYGGHVASTHFKGHLAAAPMVVRRAVPAVAEVCQPPADKSDSQAAPPMVPVPAECDLPDYNDALTAPPTMDVQCRDLDSRSPPTTGVQWRDLLDENDSRALPPIMDVQWRDLPDVDDSRAVPPTTDAQWREAEGLLLDDRSNVSGSMPRRIRENVSLSTPRSISSSVPWSASTPRLPSGPSSIGSTPRAPSSIVSTPRLRHDLESPFRYTSAPSGMPDQSFGVVLDNRCRSLPISVMPPISEQAETQTLILCDDDVAKSSPPSRAPPSPQAEELQAQAEEQCAVEELFNTFDADRDGKLNENEFKAYLDGIANWGLGVYNEEDWAASWRKECDNLESTTEGIHWVQFSSILYGKFRFGQARLDLETYNNQALRPGDIMRIHSLTKAVEFNGKTCVVRNVLASGRWQVQLDTGETMNVKLENLEPVMEAYVQGVLPATSTPDRVDRQVDALRGQLQRLEASLQNTPRTSIADSIGNVSGGHLGHTRSSGSIAEAAAGRTGNLY